MEPNEACKNPSETSEQEVEGIYENSDPTETPEAGVCIDAMLLSGFKDEELIYTSHRTSKTLCDAEGSCATAGHMVEWKGAGMMMKTYCETFVVGGCDERVIRVNSPKWYRGRRVRSKTVDLHFTAIAAKYETRAEELALSTAIRLGM